MQLNAIDIVHSALLNIYTHIICIIQLYMFIYIRIYIYECMCFCAKLTSYVRIMFFVKHMVHIVSNIHLAMPKFSSWGRDAIKCCLPSVFKIDSQIWSDTFRTCVIILRDFDISLSIFKFERNKHIDSYMDNLIAWLFDWWKAEERPCR